MAAAVDAFVDCCSFQNGAAAVPPKGLVPVIRLDYPRAMALVNGKLSLQSAVGSVPVEKLQALCDKMYGNKTQTISHWRMIKCKEFDDENEKSVAELTHNLNVLKNKNMDLPFGSIAHAKLCSNCVVGVVTVNGEHRFRFVPRPFDAYENGGDLEPMCDEQTYDDVWHLTKIKPKKSWFEVEKCRANLIAFVNCFGHELNVANEELRPPKGRVSVFQLDYVLALAVVNGFMSLRNIGCVPERQRLQELCDTKYSDCEKQTVSHWCFIVCDTFDGECEEDVARMKHNIEGVSVKKMGLPFASVSHAKLCSNCLLGVVTVDGIYRMRFVPRRLETFGNGNAKMELMDDEETYDGKPHPSDEASIRIGNELMRFYREVGSTAAIGVMKHPYPAAMALVSGKATLRDTTFENPPTAQWKLIVSEPIGESMTKEQLEVVCAVFKSVHKMTSLSIAKAESFGDCVVGAVHSDGRQFREFKVLQPFSQMQECANVLPL